MNHYSMKFFVEMVDLKSLGIFFYPVNANKNVSLNSILGVSHYRM